MVYTLCQRLVESGKIGFEYDYMGAAEYEFGATYKCRVALEDAGELMRVRSKVKTFDKTFECVFIFPEDCKADALSLLSSLESGDYRNKSPMVSRGTTGWLILDPVPALVHMDTPEGAERAQKFLDHGHELISRRRAEEAPTL